MSVSKDLVNLLRESEKRGTQGYDTQAEVLRVDEDTVWVKIPGGVPETPIQKTIDAKAGDLVQVRVSGGNAWLVGNASAPPTDDTTAVRVEQKLTERVEVVQEELQKQIEAINIAGEENQYFWHTEEGTDTGSHITEIPQEDFIANPSGFNVLIRSVGIALRNALTELLQIASNFIRIGSATGKNVYISNENVNINDGSNTVAQFGETTRIGSTNSNSQVVIDGNNSVIGMYEAGNTGTVNLEGAFTAEKISFGGAYRNQAELKAGELAFLGTAGARSRLYIDSPNSYGNNVWFNAGGNLIMGGGEYANSLRDAAGLLDDTGEDLYLGADGKVIIHTNANTYANRKALVMETNGAVRLPGDLHFEAFNSGIRFHQQPDADYDALRLNNNNTLVIGYSGYNNSIGATYLDGNSISLNAKSAPITANQRIQAPVGLRSGTTASTSIADKSLSSGTSWQNIGSFSLPAGVWRVTATTSWASNANGARGMCISTTSTGGRLNNMAEASNSAVSGFRTNLLVDIIVNPSASTTYYINGFQSSGGALTVSPRWNAEYLGNSIASM